MATWYARHINRYCIRHGSVEETQIAFERWFRAKVLLKKSIDQTLISSIATLSLIM